MRGSPHELARSKFAEPVRYAPEHAEETRGLLELERRAYASAVLVFHGMGQQFAFSTERPGFGNSR